MDGMKNRKKRKIIGKGVLMLALSASFALGAASRGAGALAAAEEKAAGGSAEEPEAVELEEWFEMPASESSAMPGGMVRLAGGQVELGDRAVEWIDRLDLTDAAEIRAFYDTLVEASDNDGTEDYLIESSYFAADSHIIPVAEVTGTVAAREEISGAAYQVYQSYVPYIRAAYDAFDRDHPEVFWLSGETVSGYTASGKGNNASGWTYTVSIYFMLKGETSQGGFDIRAEKYRREGEIASSIELRDSRVESLLSMAGSGSTEEKLIFFNDWLTGSNEYNRSSNLNNIANDCRECICALEGRASTDGPVCEAYAKAFKVLCDGAGIPCVLVDGQARNSASSAGEPHMWNYVQVDGGWYGVDVTWNDPLGGSSGAVSGFESRDWLLAGSATEIAGMSFLTSHPVENRVSASGVSFSNGPVLEEDRYSRGGSPSPELQVIQIREVSLAGATKTYDGRTTGVTVSGITFTAEGRDVALSLGRDYTASAEFEDADAGSNKPIRVTAALQGTAAANYILEESTYTTSTGRIHKAAAPAIEAVSRSYLYTESREDSIDLAELLEGQLPADCGTVSYSVSSAENPAFVTSASVTPSGLLSYRVDGGEAGDAGSIRVTVTTRNYADAIAAINLTLTDRKPTALKEGSAVALRNSELTYGEALSGLSFRPAVFVESGTDTEVEGSLLWKAPSSVPGVGTTEAGWIFTPYDPDYLGLEGTVAISVAKATPYIAVLPAASEITEGEALSASVLTGGSVLHGNGAGGAGRDAAVAGSFVWKDPAARPGAADSGITAYGIVFMPEDSRNYNPAEAEVTLAVKKAASIPDEKWPFSDVEAVAGHWKYENIKFVYKNGLMGGVGGSDLFRPDQPLTRAMFATVLYRMAGEPEAVYKPKFTDVAAGRWYSSAVIWANDKKIVNGYSDGSYGVNDNITREQIAKMLCLFGQAQGYDTEARASLEGFTDKASVSAWAEGYLQWAVDAGMVSGKPNGDGSYRLDPRGQATRAECAKMLRMFLEKYQQKE